MQTGAHCHFGWAPAALMGYAFKPSRPLEPPLFGLKEHRTGGTAASDVIPCPRKVPSNSIDTDVLALP